MGQALDQAKRERELTKAALEAGLERLEGRVRAELDWRARLRRDGLRYAVIGGAVVVVLAGGLVLRLTLRGRRRRGERASRAERRDEASLEGLSEQLSELRERLDDRRGKGDGGALWQKLVLRATTAAGAAAGARAAREVMERFAPGTPRDPE